MMEVILRRDVPNVGRVGELVQVKPGFARNYLLPRSFAIVADSGSKKGLEQHKRMIEKAKQQLKEESEGRSSELEKIKLKIKKRFNEQGKMFGSVTAGEVVELLTAKGYSVDRRDIELPDIRDAGQYQVKLRLPGDVYSKFELQVESLVEKETKKKKSTKKKKPAADETKTKEEKDVE